MSGHRLTLRFKEDVQPYLQDVTDLLYNFEKLHDLSVVMAEEEYIGFNFSNVFFVQKRQPNKT